MQNLTHNYKKLPKYLKLFTIKKHNYDKNDSPQRHHWMLPSNLKSRFDTQDGTTRPVWRRDEKIDQTRHGYYSLVMNTHEYL